MKRQTTRRTTWRFFDHTADIGLVVSAPSLALLFQGGAAALFSLVTDRRRIRPRDLRQITGEGADPAEMWINFLRSALDLYQGERFLLRKVTVVDLGSLTVTGTARGERFDPKRHPLKTEIKAVTYHQARVKRTRQGWIGRVVLDV